MQLNLMIEGNRQHISNQDMLTTVSGTQSQASNNIIWRGILKTIIIIIIPYR